MLGRRFLAICFVLTLIGAGCAGRTRRPSATPYADNTAAPERSRTPYADTHAIEGNQSNSIAVTPAASDATGDWQQMTIEGVTFEIPRGPQWRIDVVGNPCSDRLERFIVMEDQ